LTYSSYPEGFSEPNFSMIKQRKILLAFLSQKRQERGNIEEGGLALEELFI
jgi:hypothetical protein